MCLLQYFCNCVILAHFNKKSVSTIGSKFMNVKTKLIFSLFALGSVSLSGLAYADEALDIQPYMTKAKALYSNMSEDQWH